MVAAGVGVNFFSKMNKAVFIFVVLTVLLGSIASAQTQTKFDTTFLNTSSVDFFKANPSIDKIRQVNSGIYPEFIDIYTRPKKQKGKANNSSPEEFKRYNLRVAPDIYALMKEYGVPNLPEEQISISTKNRWFSSYLLDALILPDSIHLSFTFYIPEQSENPEERVFIKVEPPRGYIGGLEKMKQHLEYEIRNKKISLKKNIEDSLLTLTLILTGRDDNIGSIELTDGTHSPFSKTIMDGLIKPDMWHTSLKDGRPIRSYFKIFIRLRKDKSLSVYYR